MLKLTSIAKLDATVDELAEVLADYSEIENAMAVGNDQILQASGSEAMQMDLEELEGELDALLEKETSLLPLDHSLENLTKQLDSLPMPSSILLSKNKPKVIPNENMV
jgi:hypothetical protein